MKVVTADTMRALDRRAIEGYGMAGVVLMENAGRAVVQDCSEQLGPLAGKRIAVFCGVGNNGGDGFVAARHAHLLGARPTIFLTSDPASLKPDSHAHFVVAEKIGIPIVLLSEDPDALPPSDSFDLIFDALLGTGIADAPRPPYAAAIAHINRMGLPVVSVDVPSGVNSDTGAAAGEAVRAAMTVTFAYPKLGLYLPPGSDFVGRLSVADIGFPWSDLSVDSPYSAILLAAGGLRAGTESLPVFCSRPSEANKGDLGHVAIVGGSRGMVGAPTLVARAAQRSGAGLVTVLAPESAQHAIAGKLDEQMTAALVEADGALAAEAYEAIVRFAERASALVIGPGLTTAVGTVTLVHRLLSDVRKPIVLDADGLNALAQRPDTLARRFARFASATDAEISPVVITPHPGEAGRLLGTTATEVQSNRAGAAVELAQRYHAITVLKGRHTLIADPSGRVFINTNGNPGMATGGSGDALAGVIAGLLAQWGASRRLGAARLFAGGTLKPELLAAFGVYLHGAAGDIAARDIGEVGMTAGDIVDRLPAAIRLLEAKN